MAHRVPPQHVGPADALKLKLDAVHPVLMSNDLALSVAFYRRLGFDLRFLDDPCSPRYAAIARDGVQLHLQWQNRSHWVPGQDRPTYRFLVEDVDGLFGAFRESGAIGEPDLARSPLAAPGNTPWGTREFHLLDPDGNGLQFYCPL